MFNFSNKKKKNNKKEQLESKYTPQFGTIAEFVNQYGTEETHFSIGCDNSNQILNQIRICADDAPCNEITVINDVPKSVKNQFVIPLLREKSMSYVVYDPNDVYQKELFDNMKVHGYDVQVVDLADKNHGSRINLFEVTNITKNAYWLSVVLAGSIKCTPQEIPVAHALFMAMIQYLLATKDKVDIISLYGVFKKIKENEQKIVKELNSYPIVRGEIVKVDQASFEIRESIYRKITDNFFRTALTKTKEPNIFAATAHKKKTIYFIKKAPQRYSYLVTALLFNLKIANVIFNQGKTSLVIVDTVDTDWYNKELFRKIEKEIETDKGFVNIHIRDSIGTPENPYVRDNQLVLFMQSDDEVTKKYVIHCLKMKQIASADELKEIESDCVVKNKKKKKKNQKTLIDQDKMNAILEMSAVTMKELDDIMDCIVIDTSKKTKPFRCQLLGY